MPSFSPPIGSAHQLVDGGQGLEPREVSVEVLRVALLRAEETYLADPNLSLGVWLVRIQETISVASAAILNAIDRDEQLAAPDIAAKLTGIFADLAAEAIRAASRLEPARAQRDPQSFVLELGTIQLPERASISAAGWPYLKDSIIRCQAAVEPIAAGLRLDDNVAANRLDAEAFESILEVVREAHRAVLCLCVVGPIRSAPTVGIAGDGVRSTARQLSGRATWAWVSLMGVLGVAAVLVAGGAPAVGAVVGLFSLRYARRACRLSGDARSFAAGAVGEERVGAILANLSGPWLIEHGVKKSGGGDIDHLVSSPEATFAIDTKLNRYRSRDIGQAQRHATWVARERASQPAPIVPVICEQRSHRTPVRIEGVWVVGAPHLLRFLLTWEAG
jgi:Nuclease-related domain